MIKQFASIRNELEYLSFILRKYGKPTVAYMTTHNPETEAQWLVLRLFIRLYERSA